MKHTKSHLKATLLACGAVLFLVGFLLGRWWNTGSNSKPRRAEWDRNGSQNPVVPFTARDVKSVLQLQNKETALSPNFFHENLLDTSEPKSEGTKVRSLASSEADSDKISGAGEPSAKLGELSTDDLVDMIASGKPCAKLDALCTVEMVKMIVGGMVPKELDELGIGNMLRMLVGEESQDMLAAKILFNRIRNTRDAEQLLAIQRSIVAGLQRASARWAREALLNVLRMGFDAVSGLDEGAYTQLRNLCFEWHTCRKTQIHAALILSLWSSREKLSPQLLDNTIQAISDRLSYTPETIREVEFTLLSGLAESEGNPSAVSIGPLLNIYGLQPLEDTQLRRLCIVQLLARIEKTSESYRALDYIAKNDPYSEVRELAQTTLAKWEE